MSTFRQWATAQHDEMQVVERQRNYLRNPLPPGDGICAVCRSTAGSGFELCYQCSQHRSASGGMQADIVAPIAYSIARAQHDHNLIIYKSAQPSAVAMGNLSSLTVLYLAYHWDCFAAALGGAFTHVVTVPSTRGRQGEHPLETIVARRMPLPVLRPVPNSAYGADDRNFYRDRFYLPPGSATGGRVLLLDDTWTTGGRVQSLAFALKAAGAVAVAAVVIGRRVNPDYGPSKPLVDRLRAAPWFDITRCTPVDRPH
ncbi:phosphoribosyltransferase [Micromonospora globbae]|uniref:Phosphoribosyltransferase n=2 Tax=Micromonospora globbae TaxID=1894969 RepID=A0A420EZU2_9ACTN|nr:phosphoribosyltransferase [Micromonospora globbae]